jgi:hypothetical protein
MQNGLKAVQVFDPLEKSGNSDRAYGWIVDVEDLKYFAKKEV